MTVDVLTLHRLLYGKEGLHQFAVYLRGEGQTIGLHQFAKSVFESTAYITGVAGAGAIARLVRLERRDLPAAPRQMQRRDKPGDAGANDCYVNVAWWRRGCLPNVGRCTPPIRLEGTGFRQNWASRRHPL